MNLHLAVSAFLLGLLVSAASAACGEDSSAGSELTLEEYFQRLEAAYQRADDQEDALEDQIERSQDIDVARNVAPEFLALGEAFIADVEELVPPDVARDAHQDALDAAHALRVEVDQAIDAADDVESIDEFESLGDTDSFLTAGERYIQTCSQLQGIADELGIEVDLAC
jgi:hypothetical protein